MPIMRSLALVLRSRSYRETSLIFTAIVPGHGTLHFLGKGFREKHNGFMAPFEPLTLLETVYYERTRSHFQLLKEVSELERFPGARQNIFSYAHACYLADLVDQLVSSGHQESSIFELLIHALKRVGQVDLHRLTETFEAQLLGLAGFLPELDHCVSCGEKGVRHGRFGYEQGGIVCRRCALRTRNSLPLSAGTLETLRYLVNEPFEKALKLKTSAYVERELRLILRRFIVFRIEGELRTLRVLDQLSSMN